MAQNWDDDKSFFDNSETDRGIGLVREQGVLLFAGETTGNTEDLIESVRKERIRVIFAALPKERIMES